MHNNVNDQGIFGDFPECLKNRSKIKGVFSDLFLGDKLKVNILLAAYDMGIYREIKKAKELDDLFRGKYRKKLINEYGLTAKNADDAIMFWIEEYGCKYLGIALSCSDGNITENDDAEEEPKQIRKPKAGNNPTNKPLRHPSKKPINITTLSKGEKLPKTVLIRDKDSEESFGVDDVHISTFKGYSHNDYVGINAVGELEGKAKFGGWALIVMVVHNEKGEPIGMSSNVRFKPEELNGNYSFEMNIYIPTDELISDISFRLTYDPCF